MSPFSEPWTVIFSVLLIGVILVVLPVMRHVYRRYREPQILDCPETQDRAMVIVDATRAAWSAAIGKPRLRVIECSLWPKRKDCAQSCLKDT